MNEIEFKTNIYDIIRRNIKKYRKERGMTSAQLAELRNVPSNRVLKSKADIDRYFGGK